MSAKSIKSLNSKQGFTLLEILLVVGIIAILAGIVILAINPTKQLGDTRNAQRRSDVLTILNAAYQFSIDNNGSLPATSTSYGPIQTTTCGLGDDKEIANGDSTGSGTLIDLYAQLVVSSSSATYLVAIPHDPQATSTSASSGSGYAVTKTTGNRLTVCAPLAENGASISVTR